MSWNSDLHLTYILPESTTFQQSCQPRLKGKKKKSVINKMSPFNFVLTCCWLFWDLSTPLFFCKREVKCLWMWLFFFLILLNLRNLPSSCRYTCLEASPMVQFTSCCPTNSSPLLWALLVFLSSTGNRDKMVKCHPLKALKKKRRNNLVWAWCLIYHRVNNRFSWGSLKYLWLHFGMLFQKWPMAFQIPSC